jgi:hypothetical protein
VRWLDSGTTGGGHQYATIVLTNTSSTDCRITGSVGLIILDADQRPVPIPINVFPGNPGAVPGPAVEVMLRPGGSAAEGAVYNSDGNPPPGQASCSPTETTYKVVPPDAIGSRGLPVPGWNRAFCPADTITLSNVTAGTYFPRF